MGSKSKRVALPPVTAGFFFGSRRGSALPFHGSQAAIGASGGWSPSCEMAVHPTGGISVSSLQRFCAISSCSQTRQMNHRPDLLVSWRGGSSGSVGFSFCDDFLEEVFSFCPESLDFSGFSGICATGAGSSFAGIRQSGQTFRSVKGTLMSRHAVSPFLQRWMPSGQQVRQHCSADGGYFSMRLIATVMIAI